MPTPGRLERWAAPLGTHIRVDTACYPGWTITPYYDSLLAKVIAYGDDRPQALARLHHALHQLEVAGVSTTALFIADVIAHPDVVSGQVHTRWLEEQFLPQWTPTRPRRPPDGPHRVHRPIAPRRPAEPVGHAHARRPHPAGGRRHRPSAATARSTSPGLRRSRCSCATCSWIRGRTWTRSTPRCRTRRCAPGHAPTASSAWASPRTRSSSCGSSTLAKHGIGSLWIFDCLHNVEQMLHVAKIAQDAGMTASPQLNFSLSPVHTDEHYVGLMQRMARAGVADTIILGDEAGVLRARPRAPLDRADARARRRHPAGAALPRQDRDGRAEPPDRRRSSAARSCTPRCRSLANGHSLPSTDVAWTTCVASGTRSRWTRAAWTRSARTSPPAPRRRATRRAPPSSTAWPPSSSSSPGGMMGTLRNQLKQVGIARPPARGAGGGRPGARRARLPAHGDAVLPARRHPGAAQRPAGRAVRDDPGREPHVRRRLVRHPARRGRTGSCATARWRRSAAARSWPASRRSRR